VTVLLQQCLACRAFQYPCRDVCRICLSDSLHMTQQDADGTVVAEARICRSLEPKRLAGGPLRIGAVALDVGVRVIALLDEDVTAGARVRLRYQNSEIEDRTLLAGLSTGGAT
jgi:uncharacterized protein